MAVYKEINRADDSGVTTFYRISDILDTVETDDKESQSVVIDYNQAQNKPSINSVALVGNKTSEDLGLQPAGDYITNNEADEKFIDEDELEAKNYVNQAELQDAIAHIEHFHREIVEALPVTGMDNVLYMVRKGGTGEDIYNEYIWVGLSNSENGYEFLGTTATDLTDYYKKSQVDAALATKVDKEGGKGLSEENYTLAEKTKLAGLKNYDDTEIQAEVSGLNTDINNLKKSNVTISNTLAELKPDIDSNTAAVSTIYDLLDNKMTAIRLVEQGDGWVWMNLEGSRLTYAQASAALGHENCMLFIEQLENDGKVIPAEYKSEGDHINVIFKDLDSLVHIMTCGEDDVVVTKDVTTTNGQVDFTVEDEAIGYTTKMTALYGKSTQATTTGKNLLDNTNGSSVTTGGITFTKNSDGSITANGTATAGINYYINGSGSIRQTLSAGTYSFSDGLGADKGEKDSTFFIYIDVYVGESHTYSFMNSYSAQTKTFEESIEITTRIVVREGQVLNNITFYPMLETGSSITPYEPYTGGQPSPSPDYPQEIKTITGNIKVTSCGKNLFDEKNITNAVISNNGTISVNSSWNMSDYINVSGGTNYTFSHNDTISSKQSLMIAEFDENKNFIKRNVQGDTNIMAPYTITTTVDTKYVLLNYNKTYGNSMLQFEKGTATSYEPYQSQTVDIDLQGNELCSLPNGTKDELVVENGIAKIIKRIGKVVLDGSESWSLSTSYNAYSFWKFNTDFGAVNGIVPKICDNFLYTTQSFDIAPIPSLCENT